MAATPERVTPERHVPHPEVRTPERFVKERPSGTEGPRDGYAAARTDPKTAWAALLSGVGSNGLQTPER